MPDWGRPARLAIAPRQLLWEDGKYPEAEYPKPGQPTGGAPGKLRRPTAETSQRVLDEATAWLKDVPGTDHGRSFAASPKT